MRGILFLLAVLGVLPATLVACRRIAPPQAPLAPTIKAGFIESADYWYNQLGFRTFMIGETELGNEKRPSIAFLDRQGDLYTLIASSLCVGDKAELKARLAEEAGWTMTEGKFTPHPLYQPNVTFSALCIVYPAAGAADEQFIASRRFCGRIGVRKLDQHYAFQQ